jgi:phospholipid-binding lipoprotein MlaA
MFKFPEKRSMGPRHAAFMLLAMAILLLTGCAATIKDDKPEKGLEAAENIAVSGESRETPVEKTESKEADAEAAEKDPLEGFNRTMYGFNENVDTYIAEPITTAYKWITPEFIQTGITNFYNNTKTVNVVLNDVLQGKLTQSAQDTGRFLVNTTIGVAGLFDVATPIGLEQHEEDFDQTLAVWGVPTGAYLVLPILGPSTTRGIPGSVVDTAANPVTYIGLPVQVLGMLNARANAEGALKFIDEAALDPYVFTRESFLQWRDYLSTDGTAKPEAGTDEFEDELDANLAEDTGKDKSAATEKAPSSPAPSAVLESKDKAPAGGSGARASVEAASPMAVQIDQKPTALKTFEPVTFDRGSAATADTALHQAESGSPAPW